jgi:hypothetical protein
MYMYENRKMEHTEIVELRGRVDKGEK